MSKNREILVLHATSEELRLALTRYDGGAVQVLGTASFWSREENSDHPALLNENTLDALANHVSQQGWKGYDLICLVGGSKVACHHFDMPPLKGTALRQAVMLKLSQQLIFDVNDTVVAIKPVARMDAAAGSQLRVEVAAAHREVCNAVVQASARAGLNLIAVSAAPAALQALAQGRLQDEPGLQGLLYVDENASTLIVMNNGSPCVTCELPMGLADLTTAMMRPIIVGDDVIQLDKAQATALRDDTGIPKPDETIASLDITGDRVLPIIEPTLQKFAKHLTQWLTFASTSADRAPVTTLRLVGPGAAIPGFTRNMARRLSLDVLEDAWLDGLVTSPESSQDWSPEPHAVVVGAVRARKNLPDLMPPEVHRERRMRRVRRAVTFCGPCVAVAIAAMAVLFENVDQTAGTSMEVRQAQLAGVERIIGVNNRQAVDVGVVNRLQDQIAEFARATPNWVGIFKELAYILPTELQVTEYVADSNEDTFKLTLRASVYTRPNGPSFDEVVQQALVLLQRSSFFRHVELVNANRQPQAGRQDAVGTLVVELGLTHPQPRKKA